MSSSSDSLKPVQNLSGQRARDLAEELGDDRFWAVESIEVFPDIVFVTLDYLGVRRHHQRWSPFPNTWEFPEWKEPAD